jgi:hypothetical protein
MTSDPTRCTRCPTLVRFVQMIRKDGSRGAVAPVDAKPAANGNIHIVGDIAEIKAYVLTGENLTKAREKGMPLYINHFATCSNAEHFRKAK